MIKGGYKIVNFKGIPLTSGSASTIKDTYAEMSNSYNKATIISGLVVGNVSYPDFFAPFVANEGVYETDVVISGHNLTIRVAANDRVTVTES